MEERSNWFWEGKPWEAFKSFAIIFSFTINFVLIIVLLLVAPLVFPVIVNNIANPIVGGLNDSFVLMSGATISQTIQLDTEMPLRMTIPLEVSTDVVLSEDVKLDSVPTSFVLPGGGGIINGNVTLVLPANTVLPIEMNMDVPVSQTVDVIMDVPVQIVLSETDLGVPFNKLQSLFTPLDALLGNLPESNDDLIDRVLLGLANAE